MRIHTTYLVFSLLVGGSGAIMAQTASQGTQPRSGADKAAQEQAIRAMRSKMAEAADSTTTLRHAGDMPKPDREAQAKALEALRAKQAELDRNPAAAHSRSAASSSSFGGSSTSSYGSSGSNTASTSARSSGGNLGSGSSTTSSGGTATTSNSRPDREAQEKAAQALRQKEAELNSNPRPVENKRATAKKGDKNAPAPTEPARELSPKERKLAELLQKYRADQLTPKEYYEQRSKILAEP